MGKKKILYLLHIDWNWIKQRPQFVAEKLSKKYYVKCIYPVSWRKWKKKKNGRADVKLVPVIVVPLGRFKIASLINHSLYNLIVWIIFHFGKYDALFLLHPNQYMGWMKREIVLYDCMDNHEAFLSYDKQKVLACNEKKLCEYARFIFVSSQYLADKLICQYQIDANKITVVRNGYSSGVQVSVGKYSNLCKNKNFTISYFGTLSNWFDFDVLLKSVKKIENIEYHLAGPIDRVLIPNHPRIIYDGVLNHNNLKEYTAQFDCFIMPFQINDIVLGVDPVKMYEYIDFKKNVISVRYAEIERFSMFVNFYSTADELIDIIKRLQEDNSLKYSEEERLSLLSQSEWDNRVKMIDMQIQKVLDK